MQKEDKLIIGGHEFHSRFILGSGKYSLKLIEAACKGCRRGNYHIGSTPREYKGSGKHSGFHS